MCLCGGTDQGIADVSVWGNRVLLMCLCGGTDQGIADVSVWGNRSGYC